MQSKRTAKRWLDVKPFMQVCLHVASDLPADGMRDTAERLLAELDQGADVPVALRSQVALFSDACDRLGVLRQSKSYKKLTALSLREGRRNALILLDRERLLTAVKDLDVAATEIRGPMLGQRYYPASDLRHTHALKFAVPDGQTHQSLVAHLQESGWQRSQSTTSQPGYRTVLTSPAGVEAELYQRLLPHTDHIPEQEFLTTTEFQIAMILCQSHFEPQKQAMRWVSDLAFVFAGTPINTANVATMINAFGLAGSCAQSLREFQILMPGSDECVPRKAVAALARRLDAAYGGTPKNTKGANAALRAYAPVQASRMRRALSKLKQAIVPRLAT